MCDLESNISDDERVKILRNLISKDFSNHRYIETEKELKEMLVSVSALTPCSSSDKFLPLHTHF